MLAQLDDNRHRSGKQQKPEQNWKRSTESHGAMGTNDSTRGTSQDGVPRGMSLAAIALDHRGT
jgi:hypothetical protein